jgi:hypothetical protein
MFLSVEWAKRWLPAIFLLLSLFLPWWMFDGTLHSWEGGGRPPVPEPGDHRLRLSFPWDDNVDAFYYVASHYYPQVEFYMVSEISFHHLPVSCFVSALIFVSGLFGLSVRSKIRTLGGLLGIAGIISYFALILPDSLLSIVNVYYPLAGQVRDFPYFGSALTETHVFTWFLSAGFYLALVGSLMLLSPLIRTSIERIRKRSSSPEQTNAEPI